jgi:predicted transcriptional regulator
MLANVLDALFGCGHRNYSFPRTIRKGARSAAASVTGTYVVCLDCGKELPYDWKSMKVVSLPQEVAGIVEPVESYVGK